MQPIDERCRSFEEDLSAFADAELDAARAAMVHAHVESCAACAARVAGLRTVDVALRGIAAAPHDAARLERLQRSVGARLRSEHAQARRDAGTARAPARRSRWKSPLVAVSLAASAAGLVLLLRPSTPLEPVVASAEAPAAVAPEVIRQAEERVATREADVAFAGKGASASPEADDGDLAAVEDAAVIERLDLLEQLASLDGAAAAPGASVAARAPAAPRNRERWQAMSPDERARMRERWRRFSALPAEEQARLLKEAAPAP